MSSYINLFRNYGNFKGFLNRRDYWISILVHSIITLLIMAGIGCLYQNPSLMRNSEQVMIYLTQFLLFYSVFMIIPILSASVRRLHTLPKSGWFLLLNLIPLIGWIVVLVNLCKKGNFETLEKLLPGLLEISERPRGGAVGVFAFIILAAGTWFVNKDMIKDYGLSDAVHIVETGESFQPNLSSTEDTIPDESVSEESSVEGSATANALSVSDPSEEKADENAVFEKQLLDAPLLVNRSSEIRLAKVTDDFYMSVTETDVRAYRECIDSGICKEPSLPSWVKANDEDDLPVVFVTKADAQVFCEWGGMRLPSEEEWQTAAASADPSAKYPWGKSFKAEKVNFAGSETLGLIPVNELEAGSGIHGMLQMLGNVREWTDEAMTRGGSYLSNKAELDIFTAYEVHPEYSGEDLGFRCAVSSDDVNDQYFYAADPAESTAFTERIASITEEVDDLVRGTDDAQMAFIPGGTFTMGLANGAINEKPAHEVTLSEYKMDIYEVTNAQYALCVSDGACTDPAYTKSLKRPEYYGNPEFDNYPVVWVTWNQANAYCEWAGGRLPTEAEWEFAARGEAGNLFPWGTAFDGSKLNFAGTGFYDTHAVDEDPNDVSEFGIYDLAGNVSEWVYDRYQENWYTITTQSENPTGPETGSYRSIRGASCQNGENNARAVFRSFAKDDTSDMFRGFRCVVGED